MDERKLNHDVVSWLAARGAFAYKIPDPQGMYVTSAAKRPFDGFAVLPNRVNLFFESKLIKNRIHAFALNRIEPHQLSNLLQIKHNGSCAVILLGFWKPRTEYWFMLFDIELINDLVSRGIKSIRAATLSRLQDKGYCISLRHNDALTLDEVIKRIVHEIPKEA